MKDPKDFCTCTDFRFPNHPRNHDRGCGPCIEKNLKLKEIPTCFFRAIDCEKPTPGWHFADFAALVEREKAVKSGEVLPDGLTDAAVGILGAEKNNPQE